MEDKRKSAGARKALLVASLGLACGAAVVMLVAARRPLPTVDLASMDVPIPGTADAPGATVAVEAAPAPATEAPATTAPAANTAPAAKTPAIKKPAAKAPVSAANASAARPTFDEPIAKTPTHETIALKPAAAEEAPRATMSAIQTAAVTINGCLERDGNTFRLKDIEGEDAPKTRSWKSGFLRKGKPKIDVVDATNNRLRLTEHVGQRVSLTGMLEDREMQARSVTRVAAYCE